MIGVYDYTVLLTYGSLISAVIGIINGFNGNQTIAIICLLVSGFFDMFDGMVARTKKNRTEFEKNFGIQLDSLADLVAFGVLPVAIGYSFSHNTQFEYLGVAISCVFVLAALIRLAFFNSLALDEENKKKPKGYIGLPVTSSALIFPVLSLFKNVSNYNVIFDIVMLLVSLLFVSKIKIKKPGKKLMMLMIAVGLIELFFVLRGHLW